MIALTGGLECLPGLSDPESSGYVAGGDERHAGHAANDEVFSPSKFDPPADFDQALRRDAEVGGGGHRIARHHREQSGPPTRHPSTLVGRDFFSAHEIGQLFASIAGSIFNALNCAGTSMCSAKPERNTTCQKP